MAVYWLRRTCRHCKEMFETRRVDALYCSSVCRQAAYRERKRKAAEGGRLVTSR